MILLIKANNFFIVYSRHARFFGEQKKLQAFEELPIPLYIEIKHNLENMKEFDDNEPEKKRIWTFIPKRLLEGVEMIEFDDNGEQISVAKIGTY